MNEIQFDANLRAAFTAPTMPTHMDHKIDAGIDRLQAGKQTKRRFALSLGAFAVAAGIFVFPAVQAQASLGGMLSALDKQFSAKVVTYSVDESGERTPISTTILTNGDVGIRDGKWVASQVDGKFASYYWDLDKKTYVEVPQPNTQVIRISQMLGSASQFSVGKRVETTRSKVGGKEVMRVVVTSVGLPERYIIEADSQTQLPFHMNVESFRQGKWRTRQEMDFTYQDIKPN